MNNNCIYIYNLTKNVSVDHLKEIFMHFGNLRDINFILDNENVNNNNFMCAKIKFENGVDAKIAKEFMNGGQIDGKIVSIKYEHGINDKEKEKSKTKQRNEKKSYMKDCTSSYSLSRKSNISNNKSKSLSIKRRKKNKKK
ncbi:RNA-binding protein s1, putative [Plasmodium gallinaceum]|uniref:RNA-binding protein s1, putative n=1 Tax=Plasmodium gallinaceum TaxID=5849 RepID=A0A1J1GYJ2_PLAGA|nr:RNA-binding protein s1, putative [Plasmodium gallinaceum]CRG96360.1 RNA-binding protein s1, putative [Plasmodium gallinaceum]